MDAFILDLIQTFINTTIDFRKALVAGNDITLLAQVIVGIAIIIHIANIAYPAIMQNRAIDFYSMGKPFVIGLIALNLNVLLAPIDAVGDAILQDAQSIYDKQLQGFPGQTPSEVLGGLSKSKTPRSLSQQYGDAGGVSFSSWGQDGGSFTPDPSIESLINKNLSADELQKVYEGDVGVSESKSFLRHLSVQAKSMVWGIFNMVYVLMIFLQQFYLAVLGILGSFAVAMSIFPAFSSSFSEWLGRYISVSLWGPIAIIVKSLLQRIISIVMSADIGGLDAAMFICNTLTFLLALLLFFIPTLAGFCVQASGGMGALQGYVHQKLSTGRHTIVETTGEKIGDGFKKTHHDPEVPHPQGGTRTGGKVGGAPPDSTSASSGSSDTGSSGKVGGRPDATGHRDVNTNK